MSKCFRCRAMTSNFACAVEQDYEKIIEDHARCTAWRLEDIWGGCSEWTASQVETLDCSQQL